MKQKLIVLSLDALQAGDLKKLQKLPYFAKLMEKASWVENVREIYPTLTYPIHTTLITGHHPKDHGIPHNQMSGITRDMPDWSIMGSDWYWYQENIQVPTLVDAIWADGRTAASVLWPVTAGDTRGYNIPEIWPVKTRGEDPRAVFEKAASPAAFARYYDDFIAHYDWKDNNDLRIYGVEIAVDLIRTQQPDLLLHHVVHLDHARHVYGDQGPQIDECLRELDVIVGRIIQATVDAGTYENTNFVILGDHGQMDIDCIFNLNIPLIQAGLIRLDENGKPHDYDAYSFSAGFSTHIHLRPDADDALRQKVYKILCQIKEQYPEQIECIYTADEILQKEGLAGEMAFVLEGKPNQMFYNSMSGETLIYTSSPQYKMYKANHGYIPDKGEKPPFLTFGPAVVPGIHIPHGDMLDVCPTLACLAGVSMSMPGQPFPFLATTAEEATR